MRRFTCLLPLLAAACAAAPQPVPVFFTNASTTLDPQARKAVATAAALMKAAPASQASLVGYTLPDATGPEQRRLATGRAQAVRDELVRDGVAPDRVHDYAGGALLPPADTPVQSRRVDISVSR